MKFQGNNISYYIFLYVYIINIIIRTCRSQDNNRFTMDTYNEKDEHLNTYNLEYDNTTQKIKDYNKILHPL